jgi:hypothetical protein
MKLDNLFVFGCSLTKDNYQDTWADLIAQDYGLTLHNCAERGAGSDFVVRRLLTADIDPSNSLVMIMWPSADRFDLWADWTVPHLLNDIEYASWADGSQPKFIDHYGNRSNQQGFILNGTIPRGYKHYYHKFFYTANQVAHDWYINVITAQLYLKSKNIKFVMSSAFPIRNPIHHHDNTFITVPEIYNKIDQESFVDHSEHEGFFNYCAERNLPFFSTDHPDTQSHRHYVDNVLKSRYEHVTKENT